MIIVVDVYYSEHGANAAAVCFKDWESEEVLDVKSTVLQSTPPYVPGEFYKRELPCIAAVLKDYDLLKTQAIIIDGYVTLNANGKLGLGGYLYEQLKERIPIIGVAKKRFHEATSNQIEITRGKSASPLFITSKGIDLNEAALLIQRMQGEFRIPTLLKMVDQKSKENFLS